MEIREDHKTEDGLSFLALIFGLASLLVMCISGYIFVQQVILDKFVEGNQNSDLAIGCLFLASEICLYLCIKSLLLKKAKHKKGRK